MPNLPIYVNLNLKEDEMKEKELLLKKTGPVHLPKKDGKLVPSISTDMSDLRRYFKQLEKLRKKYSSGKVMFSGQAA